MLILAIFTAKNGIVLVDEIDHGLHHSVHEGVWRTIYEAAKILNVQVIATTHSLECI